MISDESREALGQVAIAQAAVDRLTAVIESRIEEQEVSVEDLQEAMKDIGRSRDRRLFAMAVARNAEAVLKIISLVA